MQATAQLLKALSEETRLRILAILDNGELCVCDLMAVLDLPQSTVSRHLAYLKNHGWVTSRRKGMWIYYTLATDSTPLHTALSNALGKHLSDLKDAKEDKKALASYLQTKHATACE